MEKVLIAERQQIESQRNEVLRLQTEYEKSREAVSKNLDEDGNMAEMSDDSESYFHLVFKILLSTPISSKMEVQADVKL